MDIEAVIRARATTKVLAEEDLPAGGTLGQAALQDLLQAAGWAPFHRACDETHRCASSALKGIEPWRFHVLSAEACRRTRAHLLASPQLEQAGKIPKMLAAADVLLMATWLPNPSSDGTCGPALFEPTLANMEHIAAASAAIQNLCLAATGRGIANYWSSGGVLRSPELFEWLEIPQAEILLGAVFLFPKQTGSAEVVGSKLRSHRTGVDHWSRFVGR